MYHIYRIMPAESIRSCKVHDRSAAELLCAQANNYINETHVEGNTMLLYMEVESETKVVNGVQHYESEFLVTEFYAVLGKQVASFRNPIDAVNYCIGMDNYCYHFSPKDASSFVILYG